MRTWNRTATETLCGLCGEMVPKGAPVQLIRLQANLVDKSGNVGAAIDVKHQKLRCEKCADGKPPADLPALPVPIELRQIAKPVVGRSSMTKLGKLVGDWKERQAGV